jgi:rubrerythrin
MASESVDLTTVLGEILQVEEALEQLYRTFAERFDDDPELSELFRRMSYEEKSHADLVRFQRTLVRHNPARFQREDLRWSGVTDVLSEIERSRETSHRVDDALTSALVFESSGPELRMPDVVAGGNPGLPEMLAKLNQETREHFGRLQRFAEQRKVLVWVDEELQPA